MQYQSFPGSKGGSRSLAKLKALRFPSLAGKRFLDVGCNEGFFCGYALFDGAADVVGIDRSSGVIVRAKSRFPECRFIAQSWDTLPEGKFDVILLASALHYADDQAGLIRKLMGSLSEDGTLILEIGIAPSASNDWVLVKRSIDERYFPSRTKLGEILADYAWKIIGHSVQQAGDPLPRYVVHVRRMKPNVYLLLGSPGSGKSTLSRTLFAKAKVPVVSGDIVYTAISNGRIGVTEALNKAVSADFSTASIDIVTARVFERGLIDDIVDVWCKQGGDGEFVLDSYVPEKFHQLVKDAFIERGYLPVFISWDMEKSMAKRAVAEEKADSYIDFLAHRAFESAQTINVEKIKNEESKNLLLGWHLDQPVRGQYLLEEEETVVAGWGLPQHQVATKLQCYVRSRSGAQVFALDRSRVDVVKARLNCGDEIPEELSRCGFRFALPSDTIVDGAEFGFVVDGKEVPLVRLRSLPLQAKSSKGFARKIVGKVRSLVRG